jgi:hypothetical protein
VVMCGCWWSGLHLQSAIECNPGVCVIRMSLHPLQRCAHGPIMLLIFQIPVTGATDCPSMARCASQSCVSSRRYHQWTHFLGTLTHPTSKKKTSTYYQQLALVLLLPFRPAPNSHTPPTLFYSPSALHPLHSPRLLAIREASCAMCREVARLTCELR